MQTNSDIIVASMDALLWILLPGFVAVGSGLLAWFIMQSRMEVAIAREREALAEARGALDAQRKSMQDALHGAEESAKRKALEEFLSEMRVEERHYVREHKLLFMHRKSLVMQERHLLPQYSALQLDRARNDAGRRG